MRLLIAAIGRARQGPEAALIETYAARLTVWRLTVRELEVRKRLSGPERTAAEGALLRDAMPPGARVVALDERGRDLSSAGLAERLRGWQDDGVGDAAFLIGGADGLDEGIRARADLTLAFGRQTWPHLMVRAMLAEQLYRAQQIVAGHPYHRE